MSISAQQVKELRDKTGAGMMDCKKALTEAGGDFNKAVEVLRKKGASVAEKRAEKSANEGAILTKQVNANKSGIILEVNCETDFVAKSPDFLEFANFALELIETKKPATVDELKELEKDGKKVIDGLNDLMGKIGEKIEISRFAFVNSNDGLVVDYVHQGSKLGVLVRADNVPAAAADEYALMLKDIAMQVAAMKPYYLYRDEVPAEVIEKEMEIYKELARKEGKPEQILEKIAQGRLNKYYQENCLFEQSYIKDPAKTIADLIKEINKEKQAEAKLALFKRFHLSDEIK